MIDIITGAVAEAVMVDDRTLAVQRPSRSVSAVRQASTIPARWLPFARCVLDRESGGTFARPNSGSGARNTSSSAAGRWQFLDGQWRRGLAYMVRDRLIHAGLPKTQARNVRVYLTARPINHWPGVYQDMGFAEVVERGGWSHWRNHDRCDRLVPAGAR